MKGSILLALWLAAPPAFAAPLIPYERFTLPNGLRVIVHEDHKAPIVAVRVAYHVGGKDEPDGATGFAHLFEHLMFRGSENFKGDFYHALDAVGASEMNAETTQDTTEYFATVPAPALERVLWLESDRMGHLLGSLTNEVLKAEVGVVQNEKREREAGTPGATNEAIRSGIFPPGHPYRRSVLGSIADLEAASVEDVSAWFRKYYGATNAVVVLAGDISIGKARQLMERYFSDVPAGEPLRRMSSWVPQLPVTVSESMQAHVEQGSMQRFWPAPPGDTRDAALLGAAAHLLSGRQRAAGSGAGLASYEIAGMFWIGADAKSGTDIAVVERTLDAQLESFLKTGPTRAELRKMKSDLEAFQFVGLDSVAAKARILANAELFSGDPSFSERSMRWIQQATAADIRSVARQWIGKPHYQLTVQPFGQYQTHAAAFDRSVMPAVGDTLDLDLPPMQEATLSNGMKVVLAERHEVPALSMTMVLYNAGASAEQNGRPGTAAATYALMAAGPVKPLQELHATLGMEAGSRDASASLSVLKKNLRSALALWARALRHPQFQRSDLEQWRERSLLGLAKARTDPAAVANRVLRQALYPPGHPYAPRPDEAALVETIDLADLEDFHAQWIRPDVAKLFVVGDTTLAEITRELERAFSDWKAPPSPPPSPRDAASVAVPSWPRFILVDWPQAQQTQILAGRFVLPAGSEDVRLLNAANDILGGGTTARLGQRLRVERGWSYGITSDVDGGPDRQYWWGLSTSVQSDKAAQAVAEILDVLGDFTASRPATGAELARFVQGQSRGIPALFENPDSLLSAMVHSDAYGRPYDWIEGAKTRLDSLRLEDVNRMAREAFTPQAFTWVLLGDVSKFERTLREMELGAVEVWGR